MPAAGIGPTPGGAVCDAGGDVDDLLTALIVDGGIARGAVAAAVAAAARAGAGCACVDEDDDDEGDGGDHGEVGVRDCHSAAPTFTLTVARVR